MEIIVKHWTISPYFICFLSSFIIAYVYVEVGVYRGGVQKSYIVYSMLLNTICILYFGCAFTMVTQWLEYGEIASVGFSSLGGMMGMLLGVWIFTRIVKDHKEDILRTYVMSLGLMYGISKLGCFFAGCCHGIAYHGVGYVFYVKGAEISEKMFPIQLIESISFLFLFLLVNKWKRKMESNIVFICLIAYAALKFVLDFLRYYPERRLFSINQWVCLFVIVFVIMKKIKSASGKS